jgi:hypothetical protein
MWFTSRSHKRQPSNSRERRRAQGSSRTRAAFRPALAALEDRRLLSTLTVTNALDSGKGSLRAEIATAQAGDTVHFAGKLSGQTITLTSGELVIDKSLDIEGPSAGRLTVSGNHTSRVFDIRGGVTVTLAGLTVADGQVADDLGGGIANEAGATLDLVNDTVVGNTAYGIGGGLWNDGGATVYVRGSKFTGNQSIGSVTFSYPEEGYAAGSGGTEGGAIDNDGTAVVTNSTFNGNVALGVTGSDGTGGGGKAGAVASDGPLTVNNSTFTSNTARGGNGAAGAAGTARGDGGQAEAGAVAVFGAGNVDSISDCAFAKNQSLGGQRGDGGDGANGGDGGVGAAGAMTLDDAALTLTQTSFVHNAAVGGAGGIGGSGGAGGAGGIGRGGAYVHTVTFGASTPLSNLSEVTMADGGAAGSGGTTGQGVGGGVFDLGTFSFDGKTVIALNSASTSDNNIYS